MLKSFPTTMMAMVSFSLTLGASISAYADSAQMMSPVTDSSTAQIPWNAPDLFDDNRPACSWNGGYCDQAQDCCSGICDMNYHICRPPGLR